MEKISNTNAPLQGAIYGDIVGSPFMVENTNDRYFEIGASQTVIRKGHTLKFHSNCTEMSYGVCAVSRWLRLDEEKQSAEELRRILEADYSRHPRVRWTETTLASLSSEARSDSGTSDWAAVVRVLPVALSYPDDLVRAVQLSEAAVRATCSNEEAVSMGRAVLQAVYDSISGENTAHMRTRMEMEYGFNFSRPLDDVRAELKGAVRRPLIIMGQEVEGAYTYTDAIPGAQPSARVVTEAALRAVIDSDSWEDAVRRAVALGGPSNAVGAIAGGVAAAIYGEVTPKIAGRLYNILPSDIARHIEEQNTLRERSRHHSTSPYESMRKDALEAIIIGNDIIFVVPSERQDIRDAIISERNRLGKPGTNGCTLEELEPYIGNGNSLRGYTLEDIGQVLDSWNEPRMVTPEGATLLMKEYDSQYSGLQAYGPRPEVINLYMQDGFIVSPSVYSAPGMPSHQDRKKNFEEFSKLRDYCIQVQQEMNRAAGNADAGQIHYDTSFHLWIGEARIDIMFGDIRAASILLDSRGILKIDTGEARIVGPDARFENHREQAWASRDVFGIQEVLAPLSHIEEIKSSISYTILDEGKSIEEHHLRSDEAYARLEDHEIEDRTPVYNLHEKTPRIDLIPPGVPPAKLHMEFHKTVKAQPVRKVYTIGYGKRSRETFINLLRMSGIDTVVDVRSWPHSGRDKSGREFTPQFNEENIYRSLSRAGIAYLAGGEMLGGRSRNPQLVDACGVVDWGKASQEADYTKGIAAIRRLADEGHTVAVVCSESDPLRCHRFGMISRSLASEGIQMSHILASGECIGQADLEDMMLTRYTRLNRIPSVMTGSYSRQLQEAYSAMNEDYGYRPSAVNACRQAHVKYKP